MGVGVTRVQHHAKIIDVVINDVMRDYKSLDRAWFPIFNKDGEPILNADGTRLINFKEYFEIKNKLSSQIGFMAQTATGQSKAIMYDTDIKQIKRIINRVPPEVLERYLNPPTLEVLNDDGQRSRPTTE